MISLPYPGLLIAIEGIDGSGKSTLAKLLYEQLIVKKIATILTKEPGATPLGAHIRELLQHRTVPITAKSEFLLFAADRAQHMQDVVIPMLQAGNVVISDRFSDSSLVYQGYRNNLDMDMVKTVNGWITNGIKPDITFYVRVDADVAQQRLLCRAEKPTAFEKEQTYIANILIEGFNALYNDRSDVVILNGLKEAHDVAAHALQTVLSWKKNNSQN